MAGAQLDLLAGLAFAVVPERMARLLWWMALSPGGQVAAVMERLPAVNTDLPVSESVAPTSLSVAAEPETEITKLLRDIQAGGVKPNVSDIRRHRRCSQAKAAALRRALVELVA